MRLVLVHLRVAFFNFRQILPLFFRYYRKWTFACAHLYLRLLYVMKSPYRVSKGFLQEKGEHEIYTYGETPLITMDLIARECRILSRDCVLELGCGRGEALFWLTLFTGCCGIGIDYIPTFIQKAHKVQKVFKISKLEFRCEDMLESDLSRASVIYLAATALSDEMIAKMTERFNTLKSGTKVITVSAPLVSSHYRLEKSFQGSFPWGKSEIYLNCRIQL